MRKCRTIAPISVYAVVDFFRARGANFRRLRFAHGEMTQQELPDQVGVSRQTMVAIEGSKYSPTLELAFGIAAVFGVELGEVFQHEGGGGGAPWPRSRE